MAPDSPTGVDSPGNNEVREGDVGPLPHPETGTASGAVSELALNRLLEAEPRSVLLNIRKADFRVRAGDDDLACYFRKRRPPRCVARSWRSPRWQYALIQGA